MRSPLLGRAAGADGVFERNREAGSVLVAAMLPSSAAARVLAVVQTVLRRLGDVLFAFWLAAGVGCARQEPTALPSHAPPASPPGVEHQATMFAKGDAYEQFMGRWGTQLARLYVAFAQLRDGDRVLDVGTGTGAVALTIEATMPSSHVEGIDPSAAFLEYGRSRAKSPRVRFEVGDAQALQFENGSFDKTVAQLVMNFIPDHERALREMVRVTRPGGVVSACVWDYGAGMQMLRFFWDEAVALAPAAAPKDERNMKLSRQGQLAALWRKAALSTVEESPLSFEQRFVSFDDYWAPFLTGTGPAGTYVKSLGEDQRRELAARLRARLSGGRPDGPFTLNATANCVRGVVPTG
jgi:SAM-dependent methyltransferase